MWHFVSFIVLCLVNVKRIQLFIQCFTVIRIEIAVNRLYLLHLVTFCDALLILVIVKCLLTKSGYITKEKREVALKLQLYPA